MQKKELPHSGSAKSFTEGDSMNRILKRLVSLLLCAVLCAALLPANTVSAALNDNVIVPSITTEGFTAKAGKTFSLDYSVITYNRSDSYKYSVKIYKGTSRTEQNLVKSWEKSCKDYTANSMTNISVPVSGCEVGTYTAYSCLLKKSLIGDNFTEVLNSGNSVEITVTDQDIPLTSFSLVRVKSSTDYELLANGSTISLSTKDTATCAILLNPPTTTDSRSVTATATDVSVITIYNMAGIISIEPKKAGICYLIVRVGSKSNVYRVCVDTTPPAEVNHFGSTSMQSGVREAEANTPAKPLSAWQTISATLKRSASATAIPYELQLVEMYTGEDATMQILMESFLNTISTGEEWLLMKFKLKNNGASKLRASDVLRYDTTDFYSAGAANEVHSSYVLMSGERSGMDEFSVSAAPGETEYFWFAVRLNTFGKNYPVFSINNGYDQQETLCYLSTDPAFVAHVHTFSENWTSANGYHWHEATCGCTVEPEKCSGYAACTDAGHDHKCDECYAVLGTCADSDDNGTCDYCGQPMPVDLVKAFIERLYKVCLGRACSEDEIAFYKWMLTDQGMTGVEAAYNFVFSDEFKMNSYCERHYTIALYEAFMGREPTEEEISHWIWTIQGGSTREDVFNIFATSTEFGAVCTEAGITQGSALNLEGQSTHASGYCTVEGCHQTQGLADFSVRLYETCLGRAPVEDEINAWHYNLNSGLFTAKTAAYSFLFSDEFIGYGYDNETFVTRLYEALMGRDPAQDELAYWCWMLADQGLTREGAFNQFIDSDEFKVICAGFNVVCA